MPLEILPSLRRLESPNRAGVIQTRYMLAHAARTHPELAHSDSGSGDGILDDGVVSPILRQPLLEMPDLEVVGHGAVVVEDPEALDRVEKLRRRGRLLGGVCFGGLGFDQGVDVEELVEVGGYGDLGGRGGGGGGGGGEEDELLGGAVGEVFAHEKESDEEEEESHLEEIGIAGDGGLHGGSIRIN